MSTMLRLCIKHALKIACFKGRLHVCIGNPVQACMFLFKFWYKNILMTARKPLKLLGFLKSYNYTPTKNIPISFGIGMFFLFFIQFYLSKFFVFLF